MLQFLWFPILNLLLTLLEEFDRECSRKNFKSLFSAGIVLAVGASNLYISSNENNWCHSAWVTSLGNIKGSANHSRSLFASSLLAAGQTTNTGEHILSLSQADSSSRQRDFSTRENTFNICSSASFRRPFLINYFFLLNQMNLETSGWMLKSCSAIYNCFLLPATYSTRVPCVSSC